jgi:hypothetical protein
MSRMVALGAVLGFAIAVLALALFAKEPPKGEPPPANPTPVLVQPNPLLRPVPLRRDLGPNGPLKAVIPPQMRVVMDAGS